MTNTVIKASVLLAMSCALALFITVMSAEIAKASEQDKSAEYAQFVSTCIEDDPDTGVAEFAATDACFDYADNNGVELDNLIQSIDKGCSVNNLFEDLSCKGPQYKGYEPISQEDSSESSDASNTSPTTDNSAEYFLVDARELSEQDLRVFQANGYFGVAGDGAEQLYSPSYFDGKSISQLPEATQQQILESECYDVVGATKESATIEYIGCPQEATSQQARGETQQAPKQAAQTNLVAQRTAEIVAKSHAMLDAHPEFAPKSKTKAKK